MQMTWFIHAATSCRHAMHDNREDFPKQHRECIVGDSMRGFAGIDCERCSLRTPTPNICILNAAPLGTWFYAVQDNQSCLLVIESEDSRYISL